MFDTSIVRSQAVAAPNRIIMLIASVSIHSAAVVAAVVLTVASTQLPSSAPRQMELYRPAVLPVIPPAYGTPHGNKNATQRTAQQVAAITAPRTIPDQTPTVLPSGPAVAGPTNAADLGPIGVPWGDPNSVSTEDVIAAKPEPQIVQPLVPGGEVKPARVLHRVQPIYPEVMVRIRMSAVVTVRCIIEKNGTIRDPEVIQSSYPPFNAAVLDAVKQWTFAPGTMRGEPVDTWFELTVKFVVQ